MKEYITTGVPVENSDGRPLIWYDEYGSLEIIKILEENNPNYTFHQIVDPNTSGNPLDCDIEMFAIMKIRD